MQERFIINLIIVAIHLDFVRCLNKTQHYRKYISENECLRRPIKKNGGKINSPDSY
jgi:hypothetical protein